MELRRSGISAGLRHFGLLNAERRSNAQEFGAAICIPESAKECLHRVPQAFPAMTTHEPFFADLALARRLEATDARVGIEAARIHSQLHPESGATAEPIAGGYAIFIGPDSSFTQALGLGMETAVTESDIILAEEFFFPRGVPSRIEMCPLADPSLRTVLGNRGYRLAECANMLVRRLRPGTAYTIPSSPIDVQRCKPGDAVSWAKTVAEGFSTDQAMAEENVRTLTTLFQKPYATCVLARVDGELAGGGAFSAIDGVGAMYGASTLSRFRRRGVQTAIIHALLAAAAEAHCDIAYTLTRPASESQRNVERQGFRVAYTRSTMIKDLPRM